MTIDMFCSHLVLQINNCRQYIFTRICYQDNRYVPFKAFSDKVVDSQIQSICFFVTMTTEMSILDYVSQDVTAYNPCSAVFLLP